MNKEKYSLLLHFVFLGAFLAIYFGLGEEDNVRWNLDAILFVGSLFSAVAWLKLTRQKESNAFVRFYMRLYGIIGAIIAFLMLIELGFWHFRRGEMVAEDSNYIIRRVHQGIIISIDPDLFKLYEKHGVFERYVTTLTSDGFMYDMKSVKFHEDLSAVSFKLELTEAWKKECFGSGYSESDTASFYDVVPIHEEEFYCHRQEIGSLKKSLNNLQENKELD